MSIRNMIYAEIVEMMGGDPGAEISRDECYKELTSLSDREYLCGAYWMFKMLHPADKVTLDRLGFAGSREAMKKIIEENIGPRSSVD